MIYDSAIIGTGPAGLSAALTLKIREKSFIWFGSRNMSDKLCKAECISNYPGFINISGADLAASFRAQAEAMKIGIDEHTVTSVMPFSDHYAVMAGSEFYESKTVIIAAGTLNTATLPGETDYVGKGVSYCATCDGGLYRGKTVAVICSSERFEHEVSFLAGIAEKIYYFPLYKNVSVCADNIEMNAEKAVGIEGDGKRVSRVKLNSGNTVSVNGVFCLRDSVAISALMPQLGTEDGHISVDRSMATNIKGIFAAGDCTGRPYQYAKAIGEGNIAAHSVIEFLSRNTGGVGGT